VIICGHFDKLTTYFNLTTYQADSGLSYVSISEVFAKSSTVSHHENTRLIWGIPLFAAAPLGDAAQNKKIEQILFVSYRPRKPRQVGISLFNCDITDAHANKLRQCIRAFMKALRPVCFVCVCHFNFESALNLTSLF
jgi:hypothetical protein